MTLATDGQFNPEKQGDDVQIIVAVKADALLIAAGDTAHVGRRAVAAPIPVFGLYNALDHFGLPLYKGVNGAVTSVVDADPRLAGQRHKLPADQLGLAGRQRGSLCWSLQRRSTWLPRASAPHGPGPRRPRGGGSFASGDTGTGCCVVGHVGEGAPVTQVLLTAPLFANGGTR